MPVARRVGVALTQSWGGGDAVGPGAPGLLQAELFAVTYVTYAFPGRNLFLTAFRSTQLGGYLFQMTAV